MKAFYDHNPSVLEAVGNGSYLYRWNIKESEVTDSINGESIRQWECQEVTVWIPLTSNKITQAVIGELWDSDYEQKLINEYNSAVMGIYNEALAAEKIETYKNFLAERKRIKELVDTDCTELNIG
jgi:hypothetical protein